MRRVMMLLVVGVFLAACGGEDPIPQGGVEAEGACIDAEGGAAAMDDMVEDNERAIAALEALDLHLAADYTRDAMDHILEASDASSADPAISLPLRSAAAEMDEAAALLDEAAEEFPFGVSLVERATDRIKRASGYIQEANEAIETTDYPAC